MKCFAVTIALATVITSLLPAGASADQSKTVKVFILAGQSNMEGKAPNALLDYQAEDPKTSGQFKHLRKDGKWIVRDDVFIRYLDRKGPLTIGYGSPGCTGVELEFGTMMGDHFDEPVVLIKVAWGGHSLVKHFRPPSAGYPADLERELQEAQDRVTKNNETQKRNDPLPTMDDIKNAYGSSYRNMLAEVKETFDNCETMFPALKGKKLELAGFVWFQGWNDQYGGAEKEYASNLKQFINDVRKDLDAPKLPFVIAAMGQNGSKPATGPMLAIREAQMSIGELPEFRGNVKSFRTDLLVDKAAEELYPTWRQNIEQWKKTGGDHGYHYLGSAIWFTRIGHAMGEAMLELMEPPPRPNIIIVLADDLGFSDLGCYGGEIRTPNLDALATGGVRFTQCYNSSRCCPSRASLLTGLYPHQAGIGRFVGPEGTLPGYRGRLSDRCVTLAEVLGPAGYGTYACGKWHVNEPGPVARGFEEFYGFVHGYAVNSWEPGMMIRLPQGRPQRNYAAGEFYATAANTDHALDFLDVARQKNRPWLLYVAYQAPHFPLQAPAKLAASYVATYERGWDVLRAERLERMKKMGLVPDDLSLPPRSPIDNTAVARRLGSMTADGHNPAWDSLDAKRRADLARRMAVYAAEVETMDANIGRLVASLRQHGELDNTLILFLSDNGACAEWEPFGFDLDPKRFRNPRPGRGIDISTPDAPNVLHEGEALAAMGGPESLFSYGCAWANLCNTPLSLYKHYAHEGGIRTPLIAHWPARIVGRGGWRPHVAHVMDIMATCVELSGAKYPTNFAGHDILPPAGRSLLPALLDRPDEPRTLVFEHEGNAAIRRGDWKLVGTNALGRDSLRPGARWELYNVVSDPSEQHNLAAEKPEVVEELSRKFLAEARRTLVLPRP